MLRQTARTLYNWKGDNPPQALVDAREQNANSDNNNMNLEDWTQHWDHQDEATTLSSEAATEEDGDFSNGLVMAFTILAIGLTCVVLLALAIYVCCERRRERQRIDLQTEEAEEELNHAQKLARAKKIQQKLKMVQAPQVVSGGCSSSAHSKDITEETGDSSSSSSSTCSSDFESQQQEVPEAEDTDVESQSEGEPTTTTTIAATSATAPLKDDAPKPEATDTTCSCGITIDHQGDDVDDNCCSICLTPYEAQEWISASNNDQCKHMYHKECIEEWLMKQDGCPVCRRPYLEEEGAERDFAI